jgi:hypothetical protein
MSACLDNREVNIFFLQSRFLRLPVCLLDQGVKFAQIRREESKPHKSIDKSIVSGEQEMPQKAGANREYKQVFMPLLLLP